MGEKKELMQAVREVLPDILEDELPKYLKKHRTDLKRCLINTEGFRSEEEFEALKEKLKEETEARDEKEEALKSVRTELAVVRTAKENAECRAAQVENMARQATQEATAAVEDAHRKARAAIQEEQDRAARAVAKAREEMHRTVDEAQAACEAMTKELQEAQDVCAHYESRYATVEALAARYHDLPEAVQQGLAQIVGDGGNGAQLLVRLSQLDNYESLWNYVANLLLRGAVDAEAAETLVALADTSLQLVNASHATPILAVQDIIPGARYQPNIMQKTTTSRQQGTVSRILLRGAVYTGSGNCLQKTLVEVS